MRTLISSWGPRRRTRQGVIAAVAVLAAAPAAAAESAPDLGRPFVPTPLSQPLYDIKPPTEDPLRQRHIVTSGDGVEIWTETWLPKAKDGNVPPERMPTVLVFSPYLERGEPYTSTDALNLLVRRGFAYTMAHVRGTGVSGGCRTQLGPKEVDDAARVIEYLGRDAPWSNGRVGMYGLSHSGATQVVAAALGDPARTSYLKAIVPGAATSSWYDIRFQDGVPFFAASPTEAASDFLFDEITVDEPGEVTLEDFVVRSGCKGELFVEAADLSGDFTPFMQERESRRGTDRVRAAVLLVHGHVDLTSPLVNAGLFDRLPATTPKAAVFGTWAHDWPSDRREQVQPDWRRPDWQDMVVAWFDRYLKELPSGVESWPVVQVQGTDGQWRSEPNWPPTGGPAGQLALDARGSLGASEPRGSTTYLEGEPLLRVPGDNGPSEVYAPGTAAVFETAPLPSRLEITGLPVVDLWVSLDKPDAHFAAKVEAVAADGTLLPYGRVMGLRSAQHLDPLVNGYFAQERSKPAPVGVPIRVPLRLRPTDLVVPRGGRLRVTLAGWVNVFRGLQSRTGNSFFRGPSQISGSATSVTVLHGCDHPSVLRFLMPRTEPDLLNVREIDEPAGQPLVDNSAFTAPVSTGGIARGKVCGQGPIDPQSVESQVPRCLARRAPIGPRNIGRVRLGYSRRRLLRRVRPRPLRRTRYSYRYCVKGRSGRVSAVFSRRSRRGRVELVTTRAPGHGNRGVRVRSRAAKFRSAYPKRRRLGPGLYRASRRSPRLIGVRRGRVRFIAVANRRLLQNRRALRRALRRAG